MNPFIAKACACASVLAYPKDRHPQELSCELERALSEFTLLKGPLVGKRDDDQAIVLKHPLGVFIAFRGTCFLREWWQTNLDIRRRTYAFGRCHRGFSEAVDGLWDEIHKVAKAAHNEGKHIYLTGHSKGGAMALIAYLRLIIEAKIPVMELVTFAQPPVVYGTRFYPLPVETPVAYSRFVNCQDIGPMAPFPFDHIGNVCYFDAAGKLHDNWLLSRYWLDAIRKGLKLHYLPAVSMHSMLDYEKLVRKISHVQ
jgi:hypothetical protein